MIIKIKGLIDEDFINYKKPSMFIAFPHCTFKCEKDCGVCCCQNSDLAKQEDIEVDTVEIAQRYVKNDLTSAIVVGGMEPFDDVACLYDLVYMLRRVTDDDIVIYTGYNEHEIQLMTDAITALGNITIKYGRFVPNCESHYDDVLGVKLASPNQYAKHYA